MPRSLPTNPSLRLVKVQAKELLADHKSGNPSCCGTLRLLARFAAETDAEILASPLKLTEVQHALAMEYGFKTWTELKHRVTGAPLRDVHQRFWQGVVDGGERGRDFGGAFMDASSRISGTPLAMAVEAVGRRVLSGQALWQAMDPAEFTPVICMLSRAAEASGKDWVATARRISEGMRDGVLGPDTPEADHEQAAFWQVLGLCLASGVPLLAVFDLLKTSYAKSDALKAAVGDMRTEISTGATLTEAMSKHAELFTASVCAAVLAGESRGELERSTMAIGLALKTGDVSCLKECYMSLGNDPEAIVKEHLASAPILRAVSSLLRQACKQGASQLELTADDKHACAFLLVSGERIEVESPKLTEYDQVIARFKSMARLDCRETPNAQEGRFEMSFLGRVHMIQVRTEPHGGHERVTLRFSGKVSEGEHAVEAPVAKLLQRLIDEASNVEADKFIIGHLPDGEKMGVYAGTTGASTPDEVKRLKDGSDNFLVLAREAEASIGLAGLPFKSDLPKDQLPVLFHIPTSGGWFEADSFSCHLLPHIILEIETRCRRGDKLKVTVASNGSHVIEMVPIIIARKN